MEEALTGIIQEDPVIILEEIIIILEDPVIILEEIITTQEDLATIQETDLEDHLIIMEKDQLNMLHGIDQIMDMALEDPVIILEEIIITQEDPVIIPEDIMVIITNLIT